VELDGELASSADVTALERLVEHVPGVVTVRSNVLAAGRRDTDRRAAGP
jgi:hypothetical protein